MKHVTVVDLRHYDRKKPDEDQPPTNYGWLSSVAAALELRRLGLVPNAILTSPQPRAVRMAEIIRQVLGLTYSCYELPALNDMSSDKGFDMKRLKSECGEAGKSPEEYALCTEWSHRYLYDRSEALFTELTAWLTEHANEGDVVAMVSHGAAVEMRFLRMLLSTKTDSPVVPKQMVENTLQSGLVDLIPGGMFDTCEGGIWRNTAIAAFEKPQIVCCEQVDTFRLPAEIKALKSVYPN